MVWLIVFTLFVVMVMLLPSRFSLWRLLFLVLEKERIRVFNERKPKRIILLRHGESLGNADPEVYGRLPDWKIPLTERGHQQALEAGRVIRDIVGSENAHFFVSPYLRAYETFRDCSSYLDPKQVTWREEPRLRELEWGNLPGSEAQETYRKERDIVGRFHYRFPNGESGADVYDRVSVFLETLFRSFGKETWNRAENYVLVSHGLLIRLFLMRYFHWTVTQYESLGNLNNCQMVVLTKDRNGKYSIATMDRLYEDGSPVHFACPGFANKKNQ